MSDSLDDFFDQVGTATEDELDRDSPGTTEAAITPQTLDGSEMTIRQEKAASAWAVNGNMYWGVAQSLTHVPPGCYKAAQTPAIGTFLVQQPLKTDKLLHLPDSHSELIISEIEQFQTLKSAFTERGFLFKRGILLWGPPGSGKTSTLHQLMQLVVDRCGGVALIVGHPGLAGDALQLIRRIEPERQIVAIMEDLDGLISHHSIEGFLSLLDGEDQTDNVIFVATTNYPERLDKRFTDRPSRFDTVQFIGMPGEAARRAYLTQKDPSISAETIEQMVMLSDGFSIAHLREFIISTQCFKRGIVESAHRLAKSRHKKLSSDRNPEAPQTGFGSSLPATAAVNVAGWPTLE